VVSKNQPFFAASQNRDLGFKRGMVFALDAEKNYAEELRREEHRQRHRRK
jgi:hypothetical protein